MTDDKVKAAHVSISLAFFKALEVGLDRSSLTRFMGLHSNDYFIFKCFLNDYLEVLHLLRVLIVLMDLIVFCSTSSKA